MRPVPTVDAFLAAPVGHYYIGRQYLVWCRDAGLAGSCHWGNLTHEVIVELTRFLTWRPTEVGLRSPFDMISDAARVEKIEPDAYGFVAERFGEYLPNLQPMVRKLAFVHGGGFLGAVMAGVFPLAYAEASFRTFDDERAAFDWLGGDAPATQAEVDALVGDAVGVPVPLDALRRHLRAQQGVSTLADAARALGRSPRSLQRDLRGAGVSFRDEQDQARLEVARALLVESDLKLDAIARQVGCASLPQFSRLFRRLAGEAPSDFRARHRR